MKMDASVLLSALTLGAVFAAGSAHAQPILPDFSTAVFEPGAPIDNGYFSLDFGGTRVFAGEREEDGETVAERFELTNAGKGPTILGVQTTAQRDRSFEDDLLIEDTLDYFAQDTEGNVWYMGEDVTNFEYDDEGNLIGTNSESAWRAGENFANPSGDPAQPGWIMPALKDALTDGFTYFQEFAEDDEALDIGEQFLPLVEQSVDAGDFTDVLRVLETSPFEPDQREFKYYAPGFGLIAAEEGLDTNLQNPEIRLELIGTPEEVVGVPEPSTISLLAAGLVGMFVVNRRKKRS